MSLNFDICPAATRITQDFGCTDYTGEWLAAWCPDGHYHAGVDLAADDIAGKPVYATREATVVAMEDPAHVIRLCPELGGGLISEPYLGWYAVCLRIEEPGRAVFLEYGHLQSSVVNPGERVEPGTVLGYVGTHGASCGSHLHVEARLDGPFQGVWENPPIIDPTPYFIRSNDMWIVTGDKTDQDPHGQGAVYVTDWLTKRHIPDNDHRAVLEGILGTQTQTVPQWLIDRVVDVSGDEGYPVIDQAKVEKELQSISDAVARIEQHLASGGSGGAVDVSPIADALAALKQSQDALSQHLGVGTP